MGLLSMSKEKEQKSKWFVVATEGATTDGRNIAREWIEQMATNYDPLKTYAARINLDHLKTFFYRKDEPHSQSYGDVLELKTEEREDGKLQLLAKIKPNEYLLELNKKSQKIFTSVEINTNFADTGEAYLVGLAVTDNPASLGTEMLTFAAKAKENPFSVRKQNPENLFTAAIEANFDFSEEEEKPTFNLFEKVKELLTGKNKQDNKAFSDISQAVTLLSEHVAEMNTVYAELVSENIDLKEKITALETEFSAFKKEPAEEYAERPTVTGETDNQGFYF